MNHQDEWLSLTTAATYFKVSPQTMRKILEEEGTSVFHLSEKRFRISRTDLEALHKKRYAPLD